MSFPNTSASSGTPNRLIIYHWPTGKWAPIAPGDHEMIYTGATQTTMTIDGLDAVSGTIDGLPYPVDSRFYSGEGQLLLAGFNTSHQQGYFSGAYLAATFETGDIRFVPNKKALIRELRPLIEGSSVSFTVTIKYRNNLHSTHSSFGPVSLNSNGFAKVRKKARFHRMLISTAAADTWTHADGVDDDLAFTVMGTR